MKIKEWDKAAKVWEVLSSHSLYKHLVKKVRKEMTLPVVGFNTEQDFQKWVQEQNADITTRQEYRKKIKDFLKEVETKFGFLNLSSYKAIIRDSVFLKKINVKKLQGISPECTLHSSINKPELGAGIYIQISPYADLRDIKTYIQTQSKNIKSIQSQIISKKNLPRISNQTSGDRERNEWIYALWNMTRKELQLFSEHAENQKYKDIIISNILSELGFNVTAENVRVTAHRMNKEPYKL